jgi:hypothetical protein
VQSGEDEQNFGVIVWAIKVKFGIPNPHNYTENLTWQTSTTPAIPTYSISTDSVDVSITFNSSLYEYFNTLGQQRDVVNLDFDVRVVGTANFLSATLKEGKSTLKTLLKDITVSTDNYIVYSGENTFTTINRSLISDAETPIDVSDSAYSVRGLDLAVNANTSIIKLDDANLDFEAYLTAYYQTQVADLYNIMIELNIGTIAPFQLNQVVSLNGINYRIFGIDYYNGLYKLTLYGNGYTNG